MSTAQDPSASTLFSPPADFAARAHVQSFADYEQMYARSIRDPEGFWAEIAQANFHWQQPWRQVRDYDFANSIHIRWFIGAQTNIAYNCLDRHLAARGDQTAILWEGNQPGDDGALTYRELHAEVCKFANVLKAHGVKKGDRVSLYLPMIPELTIAMLACARIGAIHSIVFGGFSADSLADRIVDSNCQILVTADGGYRGRKFIELKDMADEAMKKSGFAGVKVRCCLVVQHVTGGDGGAQRPGVRWSAAQRVRETTGGAAPTIHMHEGRDVWWHDAMSNASAECPPEWMDAEDPLFILYTSGSTGKPKGVLHTTGGYMVQVATTFKYVFDYHDNDVWWCTADIGWVTGHSYIVYGPLCNGAKSIMFEGIPTYPDAGRFWDAVDKYQVTQFYTAPTAIRALMREGDRPVTTRKRTSLRLLGSVGEPINPEAWLWYHRVVGDGRCPIVDTWWQTETGGILITPLPGATPLKPGSATRPFFGVRPVMLDPQTGQPIEGAGSGVLCIAEPWPGMMRTVFGDHDRFRQTYFSSYKGYYFTGDGCRRDEDGYYWITGRVDDVINVSGHRMGTAEVESALVSHPKVAEAAVCGFPHEIKGQGIYAYVTLKAGETYDDALKKELVAHVRKEIGAIAAPDVIHWAPGLPKTRSDKIMRRILRKIAEMRGAGPEGAGSPPCSAHELLQQIGDTTTLADPGVVKNLIETR